MTKTILSRFILAILLVSTNSVYAQNASQYMDVFSVEFRKIQHDFYIVVLLGIAIGASCADFPVWRARPCAVVFSVNGARLKAQTRR